MRFLAQFKNVLMLLLIGAALVTALLGYWIDAAIIIAVVFINALIGFIQEGKAAEVIESIKKMLTLQVIAMKNLKYIRRVEIFYVRNCERFSRCYNF